jgi:cyclohexa-1,5-dienecarbonyl-CoA hydratase
MSEPTIRFESKGRAAWIWLARAPLNILNIAMMRELGEAIDAAAPHHDVLVFQGAGPKGFSAGADVGDHTPERVADMLNAFHGVFRRLWRANCLTVAAVHGWCLGGGCELAMFCDFLVATQSAVFGQPEIKLGAMPPIATVLLPRIVGPRAAADIILTGRNIPAPEAATLGLVTRLAPDEGLDADVQALVHELGALSPLILSMTRNELRRHVNMNFEQELSDVEAFYLEHLIRTSDATEGLRAFMEKRAPVWTGR